MTFLMEHTMIAFTIWALFTLILLAAVVIYFIVRDRKMKKQEDDLEDELKKFYDQDTQQSPTV